MKHKASNSEDSYALKIKKPRLNMATSKIKLSDSEEKLRALLIDVTHAVNKSQLHEEKVILRFAGGWVRDKLLNIPSNDIDVAINIMTGATFTGKLQEYLMDKDNQEKHCLASHDMGRVYKTEANPEKSKHLETSTMTILGYDIDFVNLRKETYTEDSRNPQMEFGTPQEDAMRRDCTINALFYNIHSDLVEDYTDGLKDLEDKLIKTPLDPKTTFLDDPLRVLRLVRFANRLDFVIDPECEAWMSNSEILDAFHRKISRERIQIELVKMLKGKRPRNALHLLDRLGLYFAIFTDPLSKDAPIPDISNWRTAYNCLEELTHTSKLGQTLLQAHSETAWLLAAYVPWSTVEKYTGHFVKGKLALGANAARVTLKLETKKINLISGCLKHYQSIIDLKNAIISKDDKTNQRDFVAKLIRSWDLQGDWRLQVVFAILVEAIDRKRFGNETNFEQNFGEWQALINHLEKMNLMDAPSIKNLVDGKTLCKVMDLKPGIWVAKALEFCMDWTLRNPDINDPTEVIEEVKKKREELGIPSVK
ncbi:Nucleotidyltransferase [Podosphaera aphanis]|nr:Nucleotidyltransferase [Podosphaera aphanis]